MFLSFIELELLLVPPRRLTLAVSWQLEVPPYPRAPVPWRAPPLRSSDPFPDPVTASLQLVPLPVVPAHLGRLVLALNAR